MAEVSTAPDAAPRNSSTSTRSNGLRRRSSLLSVASAPTSLSEWSLSLGDLFQLQPKGAVANVQRPLEEIYVVRQIELGSGDLGIIRPLQSRSSGEHRAVKTVSREKIPDLDLWSNRLAIAARAKHPHVVRLLEVFETEDSVHLVMEKCTGGNLHQRIFTRSTMKSAALPLHAVTAYITQMLSSTAYLHHYRIAHRDIKPSHYLLVDDRSDKIKLTDFSSACVFSKNGAITGRCGSAPFFAPESLEERYTCKCDVWSIGSIAYMLVAGRPPLLAESFEHYEQMLREKRVIDFEGKAWTDILDDGLTLIQRLLSWNPEERPPAKRLLRNPWLKSKGQPRRCCVPC